MAVTRFKKRNRRCSNLMKAFCFAVLILTAAAEPTTTCARFDFPTLSPNLSVRAEENRIFQIPFKLNTDTCPGNANQSHFVYVLDPSGQDYCVLRLSEYSCSDVVQKKNCPCAETGGAVFTKTVTKTDSGLWTWRTGDGVSKDVQIDFNIQTSNTTETDTRTDGSDSGKLSPFPFLTDASITTSSYASDDVTEPTVNTLNKTHQEVADQDNEVGKEKTETGKNGDRKNDEEDGLKKSKERTGIDDKDSDDEKDDDVDDDDDTGLPESVITGVVFVVANIVTIIAVAVIVIMIKRRRKRQRERTGNTPERRRPNATLPPRPQSNAAYDVTSPRMYDLRTQSSCNHNYLALPGRQTSGIYEEIPAGKERASDSYLTPVSKEARSSNAYDDAV